ncbi:MAG: hypothetical protein IPM35_00200 [Myxococcales bacterium]|nr:hypothetical protein [Myxococcales bacterium]
MRRFRFALVLAGLVVGLLRCSSEDDAKNVCEPGRQIACACLSGSGIQVCRGDGSGYAACQCGDAGADASAGMGGGGAAGSGGGPSGGSGGSSTGGSSSGGASGSGGVAGDAGGSCAPGTATNVTGSCDLVAQNCPAGQTCRIQQTDAGSYVSACIDLGNGTKKLGESCSTHGDCQAKLSCALSKCTRPCCSALEATLCGPSGSCDMKISYGSSDFVQVCTFSAPCTPWAKDCPPGPESDCHVGSGGKLKCSFPNYAPDAGSTLGLPCQFLNDCQDSQQCDFSSGSGVCRWLCKASATGAPDAGSVGGTPGNGGCPSGQTCKAYSSPSWLGVCSP